MKVYELHHDGGMLMRAIRRSRSQEGTRTGLHVSDICDDFIKQIDKKRYEQEINEVSTLGFQEIGNALEDVVGEALQTRFRGWCKPDPRHDERGVIGSPDGYLHPRAGRHRRAASLRPGGTIDEIKATWVSEGLQAEDSKDGQARNPFIVVDGEGRLVEESLKFTRYRMQATHYAYMWGAVRIRFHILFVAGNYRPPFPNSRTITVLLSEKDKRDNAHLLWQHAEDLGWLVKDGRRWITNHPRDRKAA